MSAYDAVQKGDVTEFSTTPEKVPLPLGMIAIPGVLLTIIGFSISWIMGLICVGFCYGAIYLLTHSKQATLHRQPSQFRVSKDSIQIGGTTIPKEAIHRVVVRNHLFKSAENIVIVPSLTPNSGQSNTVAGMNWALQKIGPVAYRGDVEARGTPTTLAGGLTEPAASAIASDVNRLLQLAPQAAGN